MRTSLPPAFFIDSYRPYDAAFDDDIATCNGDLLGALKGLIIANEFIERDLERASASDGSASIAYDFNVGFRHANWVEGGAT